VTHPELDTVIAKYSKGPDTGVFTDGSCEGNPGRGGWGFVWVEAGEVHAYGCRRDSDTTNNRMELSALIGAYKKLPEDAALTMYSDSQICVKTVNEWAAGWQRRGWKRKTGPIANLELVQKLYALSKSHPKVKLQWVKAHDGTRWNEYVDTLANLALAGEIDG
jgi:ribonuclease HI